MDNQSPPARSRWFAGAALLAIVGIGLFVFRDRWRPLLVSEDRSISKAGDEGSGSSHDHDDEHDHGHDHEHDDGTRLHLSSQALKNLGISEEFIQPVRLQPFDRSVTVPAIIVARPGRTYVEVSTPMAGVVTHIHAVQGEAVTPGTLLFELRITAEELVESQTELLKTTGELDVEQRELARLEKVTDSGAIPLRTRLEHEYARDKLLAMRDAQREALRLHGVSEHDIEQLETRRRLLRDLQIVAPDPDEHSDEELKELKLSDGVKPDSGSPAPSEPPPAADDPSGVQLVLNEVRIHKGQTVAAGETLAVLAEYSELYLEGRAFEQDLPALNAAVRSGRKATAIFDLPGGKTSRVGDLDIVFTGSEIEARSRTLPFYVRLPNTIAATSKSPNGFQFIDWTYRPGQRLQVTAPVEHWENQIVLPLDAVARDGAEAYVFQQRDDGFERVPVHIRYRDQSSVVIANDGSLTPGNRVALRGAHQMLIALKNQSGGPVDPHAGHMH